MSMFYYEDVICPRCGKEGRFARWASVNAVLDPDLAEQARSGKLNQYTCRACGCTAQVCPDILVNDGGKMTFYLSKKA